MKNIKFIFFLTVVLLGFFVFGYMPVSAADSVSFKTVDVETDNNRLFSVDVIASSDKPLCAAIFEFSYDKNLAEFRNVDTDKSSKVVGNEKEDCVMVSYLNTYGKEISGGEVIFTLEFKALDEGSLSLEYTVSDCVDTDVKQMEIDSVVSGDIKINEKSEKALSKDKTSKSSNSTGASSKKSEKSSVKDEDKQPTTGDSLKNLGVIGDIGGNNESAKLVVAVIIICLIFVLAAAVIAFVFRRKLIAKKSVPHPQEFKQTQEKEFEQTQEE